MTYRNLAPWPPLEEFLAKPLHERVAFVRKNLASPRQGARTAYLTLDEFAVAVGAKDRHRPIGWEKGQTPRDYAERIAALTPYPPSALGADGAAELERETFGARLAELAAKLADTDEALTKLRASHRRLQGRVRTLEATQHVHAAVVPTDPATGAR